MNKLETSAQRTRLGVAVVTVAVLVGSSAVAWRQLVRERWAKPLREREAAAAAAVDTFCAGDAALALHPVFQPGPRARDAAPWLHPLVGFGAASTDGGVPVPAGALVVPQPVKDALGASKAFMDALDDALAASMDTSALSRAHDYDHWELTGALSPLAPGASWNAADAPLPNFMLLLQAAKVHLARGGRAGSLKDAARDVRQLARLCLTTESLLGAMVGVALLSVERDAHAWALAHGADTSDWTPVDADTTAQAKAVLRLASVFFGPAANEATFARALACAQASRCVGLTEAVTLVGALAPKLPEPSASRVKAALGVVSTPGHGCSFATARYFAARPLTDELAEAPTWMPLTDVYGILLTVAAGDEAPLGVLLDAGVPFADGGTR